jgi:Ca-activated chloride channel family protein
MSNVLILLSDGNATDSEEHGRFRRLLERGGAVRIFSIGIGNEVNRPLLNTLAQATGGYSDFISSADDVERKSKALSAKILHPVAENLEVKIDGVKTYDLVPAKLPNFFRGQQLAVYGRYKNGGKAKVTVAGTAGAHPMTVSTDVEFPSTARDNPEIRRMWAWKKTDEVMQEIRSRGETSSRIEEIVGLGKEYSIVTPYTSFLVLENDQQFQQFGIEQRNARQIREDRAAQDRRTADAPSPTTHRGGGGSVELGLVALVGALALLRRKAA